MPVSEAAGRDRVEVVTTAGAVVDAHPQLDRGGEAVAGAVEEGARVVACAVLGVERDGVLEVEDDGVGAGGDGLVEAIAAVTGDVEEGVGGHRQPRSPYVACMATTPSHRTARAVPDDVAGSGGVATIVTC